jgi:hypothetical protein
MPKQVCEQKRWSRRIGLNVSPHCSHGFGSMSERRRPIPEHSREHQRPEDVGCSWKVLPQTSQVLLPRRPQDLQYFARLLPGTKRAPQEAQDLSLTGVAMPLV